MLEDIKYILLMQLSKFDQQPKMDGRPDNYYFRTYFLFLEEESMKFHIKFLNELFHKDKLHLDFRKMIHNRYKVNISVKTELELEIIKV